MILLIDNYDSFTYNLYQYLGELGVEVLVKRNDQLTIREIEELSPEAIVLSPGPGRPEQAGICVKAIQNFYQTIPMLGICLGHQAIGHAFGAEIKKATQIKHGKGSLITHNGTGLFQSFSEPLEVMRYHSLVISKETLCEQFSIDATAIDDGEIMAIKHKQYPLFGLQFHPESVGTIHGKPLLQAFITSIKGANGDESLLTTTR